MIQNRWANFACFCTVTFCAATLAPHQEASAIVVQDYSEVTTGSSPDSSYENVVAAISGARSSIRLSAYMLRSPYITDYLVDAAKRGVRVTLLLDGWTVARPKNEKIDPKELYNAYRITNAGGKVIYLASDDGLHRDRRFPYLHTKYIIIDEEVVFISSENFATSGFSTTKTVGTRGWVITIKNAALARDYVKIFDKDTQPIKGFKDLVAYGESSDYRLADPSSVKEDREERHGKYFPVPSRVVREEMRLERIVSPEDSPALDRAIVGAIKSAKRTLYIQSLAFQPHWGSEGEDPRKNPSDYAEAVLAAARRGVSVRIMLQPPFFARPPSDKGKDGDSDGEKGNTDTDDFDSLSDLLPSANNVAANPLLETLFPVNGQIINLKERPVSNKDNKALIAYFRKAARRESLDLQTSMFWVDDNNLKTLHNKGLVADGETTLVSSVNWSANSIRNNREAAVLVTNKRVADYYQTLFLKDWEENRNKQ